MLFYIPAYHQLAQPQARDGKLFLIFISFSTQKKKPFEFPLIIILNLFQRSLKAGQEMALEKCGCSFNRTM